MKIYKFLIIIFFFSKNIFSFSEKDFLDLLHKSDSTYNTINNYSCIYSQKERIGDALYGKKNIYMKFQKPFSIYMKFTDGDNVGSEVIFVKNRYNNKIKFHFGSGLFRYFVFNLDSQKKLENSNHTIYDAGIGYIIYQLKKNVSLGLKNKDVLIYKISDNINSAYYKLIFPKNDPIYYAHIMEVSFNKKNNLLDSISLFRDDDLLFEKFSYQNLVINGKIQESDFDIKNSNYKF